mgnify:CR=1 FL=1
MDVVKGKSVTTKGLKGIIAADSSICLVNGQEGRLVYRGYNIHELAEKSSFEEVSYLLLRGELPTSNELAAFSKSLADSRDIPAATLKLIQSFPQNIPPMTALRTATSALGMADADAEDNDPEANFEKSIDLIARLSSVIAAIHRIRQGKEPLPPKPELSHAGNFMWQLNGREPSADETKAMDLILILHAEHGLNASTFAGRVIIATLTDIYSAVTGAIGALKGPLHGGANVEVLKALQKIGDVKNVGAFVEEVRAAKGKFMGFGHAVYQVEDPRAMHLKELSRRLGIEKGETKWYDISIELEGQVKEAINKNCNVDFYSASLQHYMGIPGDIFTCIFAASRISGWCAHILEQLADNKIIRPSANYIGSEERSYVPIDER